MGVPDFKSYTIMIKKLVMVLLAALFAVSAACSMPVFAAMGDEGLETLVVGVPTDRAPVFYVDDETGEVAGIGVDLMTLAAEEAGFKAAFKDIGDVTIKDALDNPEYDVVMPFGSAISSTSGRFSVVSDNLTQTPFTLVTDNKHEIRAFDHLRVGMLHSLAGVSETVKKLYPDMEIVMYDDMSSCVKALRAGEVDALLHNSFVWSYVMQKPAYSDLKVQISAIFSMDFRAGTLATAEGTEIIERLNGGIARITDTQRQAIVLDHTTRRIYEYDLGDYIHRYGLIMFMGTLVVVFLFISIILRQRAFHLENEEKMRRMIDHDPLTGAYSLNGFRKRVEELLREHPDIPYMISYNNIKDFKFINDSLGWEAGDEILKYWVSKSLEVLSDEEAMGRIDADHMAVLRRIGGDEQMNADDEMVFRSMRNFFIDRGKEIKVRLCSGIYVLTPEDYQNIDVARMLDYARVAEKRVQDDTQDGYEFYNETQWEKGRRDADIVSRLPVAIESGELQVWYQPQVDYAEGRIIGAEALCRWKHAKLGFISPGEFIPALEEAGLILDLDRFVWDRVCQDLKRWNDAGERKVVSVNLSRCNLNGRIDLPMHFSNLVKKYDIEPSQLNIEITETAYVQDSEFLIKTTQELKEKGFNVEMDDFGSGYSSLNMLKDVPVDRVKLDLRFLAKSRNPKMGQIIISYMIKMIADLGMGIIAEGVETKEQAESLKQHGCIEMQGFYFYRPMPSKDFEKIN